MRTQSLAGLVLSIAALGGASSCSATGPEVEPLPAGAECRSLLGEPLYAPPIPADKVAEREAALASARAAWDANPRDPARLIEVGRRTANLNRFREALGWFERGVKDFPEDPRMQRFRGHRLITLRRFTEARAALERAAELAVGWPDELEPNLEPKASGAELEYFQPNVWYHLGLASYLQGDYDSAAESWRQCLELANNVDSRCSALHWLYTALARAGRADEGRALVAEVRADWPVLEYAAYHALTLVYNGTRDAEEVLSEFRAKGGVDFATAGYGLGNYFFTQGDRERAAAIWAEIERQPDWHAFGHIAAEAELARM